MNNKMTVEASVDNIEVVTFFVNELLDENDCSMRSQVQIDVAIDEIFSNVIHYAYGDETGNVEVGVDFDSVPGSVVISFVDSGIPYNPIEQEDPDVTLSVEDRKIGGLGIFIVRSTMDDVSYKYENNKNMLFITKELEI